MRRTYTRDEYAQDELDILENLYTKNEVKNIDLKVNALLKVTIVSKTKDYIVVDFGGNEDGFILCKNEPLDMIENLSVGLSIDAMVIEKDNHSFGNIFSVGEVSQYIKLNELIDSIGNKSVAYNCYVTNLIPKVGYNVEIDGIAAFMPGSLASMNLLSSPESIVGTTIPVMMVNFIQANKTLVCSHKDYLEIVVKQKMTSISKGDKYVGTVTGVSDFGVFIEFEGCLTGMIHKTDLNENYLKSYNEKGIVPGDELEFTIKNIVNDKRIILTQLDITKDPWYNIEKKYQNNKAYTGKVVDIKPYGLLVEFEPGVRGLFVSSDGKYAVGSTIKTRIKSIDTKKHKIQLY